MLNCWNSGSNNFRTSLQCDALNMMADIGIRCVGSLLTNSRANLWFPDMVWHGNCSLRNLLFMQNPLSSSCKLKVLWSNYRNLDSGLIDPVQMSVRVTYSDLPGTTSWIAGLDSCAWATQSDSRYFKVICNCIFISEVSSVRLQTLEGCIRQTVLFYAVSFGILMRYASVSNCCLFLENKGQWIELRISKEALTGAHFPLEAFGFESVLQWQFPEPVNWCP